MARRSRSSRDYSYEAKVERSLPPHANNLPRYDRNPRYNTAGQEVNHNGHAVTPGIRPEGESGRKGIHPLKFLKICFKSSSTLSMMVNVLWPIVPVAIALVCPVVLVTVVQC